MPHTICLKLNKQALQRCKHCSVFLRFPQTLTLTIIPMINIQWSYFSLLYLARNVAIISSNIGLNADLLIPLEKRAGYVMAPSTKA